MDESALVRGVLGSLLGGRRRRSRRALRFFTGSGPLWSRRAGLLTAAGLAWGVIETLAASKAASPGTPVPPIPERSAEEGDDGRRMVSLAAATAAADGVVDDEERSAILGEAARHGVQAVVEAELARPRALEEIVRGVIDPGARATLYTLAFGIARGDERPNGAERIFLAKLAHLLDLDPSTVEALEHGAGQRIDHSDGS